CMTRKENGQHMTSQELQMTIFDNLGIEDESTLSVEDSHAKLFQSLGNVKGSMTLEELYSLTSLVSQVSSDHAIYSLKTSEDCSTTTTEIPSRPSSERWMNSGMMSNGICLTLRTSESDTTGSEYSLLDIIEEPVIKKYSLSERERKRLMKSKYRSDLEQTLHPYSLSPCLRAQGEILRVGFILETLPQESISDYKALQ